MNLYTDHHSWGWIAFTYASFIVSLAMVALAIVFIEAAQSFTVDTRTVDTRIHLILHTHAPQVHCEL
jgi:hypothetical protein